MSNEERSAAEMADEIVDAVNRRKALGVSGSFDYGDPVMSRRCAEIEKDLSRGHYARRAADMRYLLDRVEAARTRLLMMERERDYERACRQAAERGGHEWMTKAIARLQEVEALHNAIKEL